MLVVSGRLGLTRPHATPSRKPKRARSKRALEAREPKEIEEARTAVFVRGTHAGEVVLGAMKELVRAAVCAVAPD